MILGKHETLYEDANLLLREMGVPDVKFPPPPVSDTRQRINQQFLNLSHTTVAQLYKLFLMDFKLFNYDLKAISNSVTYVYVDEHDSTSPKNVSESLIVTEFPVGLSNISSTTNFSSSGNQKHSKISWHGANNVHRDLCSL